MGRPALIMNAPRVEPLLLEHAQIKLSHRLSAAPEFTVPVILTAGHDYLGAQMPPVPGPDNSRR